MTESIAAVVFDLDGTLVDSRADIAASANFALAQHGLATHPEEVIGGFVGDGAKNLILRAAAIDENHPMLPALLESFLEHYAAHAAEQTTLMPGAAEAIAALGHLPLAILTNKPRQPTLALLEALGYLDRFAVIIAGGDFPWLKPDPRPLLHLASVLGLPATRLVMVGDGPQDVNCGRAAGTRTVGIKGGLAALDRLVAANPDCLIDSLFELPAALQELNELD